MIYISENLRFLLWNEKVERGQWIATLATWLDCDISRAQELLFENSKIRSHELKRLGKAIKFLIPKDIVETRFLEDEEIPLFNIHYLLDSLPRGKRKDLAKSLEVHELTISRWYAGTQTPSERHFEGLAKFFGIPPNMDIRTEPIFLSLEPMTDTERKKWLEERIKQLDTIMLNKLFPALERLLKEDSSHTQSI